MMLHNLFAYCVKDYLFWFISFGLRYPFPNTRMSLFFQLTIDPVSSNITDFQLLKSGSFSGGKKRILSSLWVNIQILPICRLPKFGLEKKVEMIKCHPRQKRNLGIPFKHGHNKQKTSLKMFYALHFRGRMIVKY